MKRITNRRVVINNKLVMRVLDLDTGKMFSQGKRVGKDCKVPLEIRQTYVKRGFGPAVLALTQSGKLRWFREQL